MENCWKNQFDDEGRSFVSFLREDDDQTVTCVACSTKIQKKEDFEEIYNHTRTIEHGFKLYVMLNVQVMQVIDLTNFNCDDQENRLAEPEKLNIEIARNADGTLKISGFNPIEYVIPIRDLPLVKNKIYERETSRKTVLSSLDNYLTKGSSPSKRKQSERNSDSPEQSSSVYETSHKKRKTSQLTLARWVKKDEPNTLNRSVSTSPQNILKPNQQENLSTSPQSIQQQQLQSVTQMSLSEGITRINEVRPTKRDISQIIRARVLIKSDVHPFFNRLGPSTMLTLDLIDESGEIRLSAFGTNADKLNDSVEVDQIYYFSKFRVKLSDPSKSPLISMYSIKYTEHTMIRPCVLVPFEIPRIKFKFQPISDVGNMAKDDIVDVIAICESFDEVEHKRLSSGSAGKSRAIWLVDMSNTKILLYVWGSNADNFEKNRPGDVVAVKRAKVKTYAKLNLDSSCLSSSTFEINPKMPEADLLRKWYCQKGTKLSFKVLSSKPKARAKKTC